MEFSSAITPASVAFSVTEAANASNDKHSSNTTVAPNNCVATSWWYEPLIPCMAIFVSITFPIMGHIKKPRTFAQGLQFVCLNTIPPATFRYRSSKKRYKMCLFSFLGQMYTQNRNKQIFYKLKFPNKTPKT